MPPSATGINWYAWHAGWHDLGRFERAVKISAYILAADPAWIEASVLSYYHAIDSLIISFDKCRRGWTGSPIKADECIDRIRAIDKDNKVRLVPGDFYRMSHAAMENETFQRQAALEVAGNGVDWVLQLDADEILPKAPKFIERLRNDVPFDYSAVDWPMRTFFNRTARGEFLEVCSLTGRQISAYPGPVAVRPGTVLTHARQTSLPRWRYDVRSHDSDPAAGGRTVNGVVPADEAIAHLSWIRSEDEILSKLKSWGHSHQFDWQRYLDRVWRPAGHRWRFTFWFHPLCRRWWPALRRVSLSVD